MKKGLGFYLVCLMCFPDKNKELYPFNDIMLTKAPKGLSEIIKIFGDINHKDFEAKNIVSFDLPYPLIYNGQIMVKTRGHRLLVENFTQAFTEIKANGFESDVKNYGGIYAVRNIRGENHPSTHTWGIAIDLEPNRFPLGSLKRFPQPIVDIFKRHGFSYGGDFTHRKDGMHFQFATDY